MGAAPLENPENHHWQHTWGTKFPKNKINRGVGWGRLGLSKTLFVLLCSCVCVGVVPLGLGGGGSSQATRRTWFTVNIPSGDGSARKVVRAAPAAANFQKSNHWGGGCAQATTLQRELLVCCAPPEIDDRRSPEVRTHDVLRTSGDRVRGFWPTFKKEIA